jgi:hypothetical protein
MAALADALEEFSADGEWTRVMAKGTGVGQVGGNLNAQRWDDRGPGGPAFRSTHSPCVRNGLQHDIMCDVRHLGRGSMHGRMGGGRGY